MTRKLLPLAILPLLAVLLAAGCMGLGAAAVAGGIVYYKSSHHESATVNLQDIDVQEGMIAFEYGSSYDDTNPEPEDVWRYDRDFRAALTEEQA